MKKVPERTPTRKLRPALTPEAEENQMISLAVDLAKKQLMEGTASSQVITHFLKLGSSKEKLEREKLEKENELLRAKTEALQSAKKVQWLMDWSYKIYFCLGYIQCHLCILQEDKVICLCR